MFEEERFIFPQSYGLNRVRLLVKDPHWLFAHWDIDPGVRDNLRKEKGERVAALARLTLRLTGAGVSGESVVLPEGARSTCGFTRHGSYRELGLTLPSGSTSLAQSNPVRPREWGPGEGDAPDLVPPRHYPGAAALRVGGEPVASHCVRSVALRRRREERRRPSRRAAGREPGPCLLPSPVRPRAGEPATSSVDSPAGGRSFRPGA